MGLPFLNILYSFLLLILQEFLVTDQVSFE